MQHAAEQGKVFGFDHLIQMQIVNGFAHHQPGLHQLYLHFGGRGLVAEHAVDFGENLVLLGFDFQHGISTVNRRAGNAVEGTQKGTGQHGCGDGIFVVDQAAQLLA